MSLAVCAGCRTAPPGPTSPEGHAKLQSVNPADGISESEAWIIGRCYFAKHVGCGVFTGIRDDGGDRWIVEGVSGIIGLPKPCVFIDKHSGKVASLIGPGYDNPLDIFP
jgi:hypothetical protein